MTTPHVDDREAWLRRCAADALLEVMAGFSPSRLRRMKDPLTWTEVIDGEEVQFEVMFLEGTDEALHVGVSATLSIRLGTLLGMNGPSAVIDEIFPV